MTDQFSPNERSDSAAHLSDHELAMLADPRLAEAEGAAAPPTETRLTETQQHLALCAPCRDALAATERALNALRDPVNMLEPPAGLWDRIAAEIAETPAASDTTPASDSPAATPQRVAGVHPLPVRSQPSRNRRWVPLAAAAAGLLIGGAAVAGVLGQGNEEETPAEPSVAEPTLLGDASLEPVAAEDFSGRAEMVETDDGQLELTVEVSEAPDPEAGYFEVWLRNEDGSRLQSLGVVTGTESTTFQVPEGLDLSEYPVVDVSHEHFDGDPGHSGTTLAAGPMEPADS
ncbi:anti-sigma factor [Nesterenkonia halotolerans]|uniref:anti-sigma factor n=1 Tax=Nesterenkonia halotolerans TaxID=225325 RepID=UPI003EE6C343